MPTLYEVGCAMTARVNWEAVGALGTWGVGVAAAALAWKANSVTQAVQEANRQRDAKAVFEAQATARALLTAHVFRLWNVEMRLAQTAVAAEFVAGRAPSEGALKTLSTEMELLMGGTEMTVGALVPYLAAMQVDVTHEVAGVQTVIEQAHSSARHYSRALAKQAPLVSKVDPALLLTYADDMTSISRTVMHFAQIVDGSRLKLAAAAGVAETKTLDGFIEELRGVYQLRQALDAKPPTASDG